MTTSKPRNTDIRRAIVQYLTGHPGATSINIAEALGHNPTGISGVLSRMHDHGMVARQRVGNCYHYILRAGWDDDASTDEVPGTSQQVAELHAKIVELEAWRDEASKRFPELVAPDYEPYRDVLVRFYHLYFGRSGFEAEDGKLDDTDIGYVKAILATAEEFLAVRDSLKG